MHTKLKEIAVKAQVEHCISHVRLEEFAELIIKECATMTDTYVSMKVDASMLSSLMLQSFGVTK